MNKKTRKLWKAILLLMITVTTFGTFQAFSVTGKAETIMGKQENGYNAVNESLDTTTIYYRGYTNPKIHYQVGNGAWTDNNGVCMTPCTDVEGFDYSITINLNGASGITACFNDGNGNWDNNNRQDYKFGSGYYTCKNGVVTKIEKPSSELKINSVTSSEGEVIRFGTSTNITINASGGSGGYKYSLHYYLYGSGRIRYLLNESFNNTVEFTPDYPRPAYLYIEVTDSAGNKVSMQKIIQVHQVGENYIAIYYRASNATNIHYQIGNGAWTDAPGVAMEVASDRVGYYKIIINLGTETTLKACFNDGNNWDNNDSRDYYFGSPGTYTVENKTITKNN